jgi:hypothetical protein
MFSILGLQDSWRGASKSCLVSDHGNSAQSRIASIAQSYVIDVTKIDMTRLVHGEPCTDAREYEMQCALPPTLCYQHLLACLMLIWNRCA